MTADELLAEIARLYRQLNALPAQARPGGHGHRAEVGSPLYHALAGRIQDLSARYLATTHQRLVRSGPQV